MGGPETSLLPIGGADDIRRVAEFLHRYLNPAVSVGAWSVLLDPPWGGGPDHGYQLVHPTDGVVGAYVVVCSTRPCGLSVCNLAAFCVLEPFRLQAPRLVRAVLRPKDRLYTDLSPSGNVPAMNERLGFQHLDTATKLVVNLPGSVRGVRTSDDPEVLGRLLTGRDAEIYDDHRIMPAARHLLVESDDGVAYLMYRRDRRKGLPLFASPLYVGGRRSVLRSAWPAAAQHLLRRGLVATLAERRVLQFVPRGPGRALGRPRPKMYRSALGAEEEVDYLYSELALVEW